MPSHVLVEQILGVAGARVDQRAADPADGVVPPADQLVAAAPGARLDDAQLDVFRPARRLLVHRAGLPDPVQVLLEGLRHALPGGQPVPELGRAGSMSSFGGKPVVTGARPSARAGGPARPQAPRCPPARPCIWSRQVAANDGGTQLARGPPPARAAPAAPAGRRSLDRGGQGGQALRAEALQREPVLDRAFGLGQPVAYVAQLGRRARPAPTGDGRSVRRRAGAGAPAAQSAGVEHPGQPVTAPRSRPRPAGRRTDGSISSGI